MSKFDYSRRRSQAVAVGCTAIGGDNPVRLQSMASTSTMDTDGSVAQARRIINAGAELLRFTAQGVREAENLGLIRSCLRAEGVETPLVADIHFNPRAAFAAATQVEKVRINPGNFVDPGRTFKKIEYTEEEYVHELERLEEALVPFLEVCRENNTAIRLGVNHGSLSDRIMSRYGDTPAGMVESAMEFLHVCKKADFDRVVISIKASNVVVMVTTVNLLVKAMDAEGLNYPLHLGVTEAGDGEDGRVKSAVGIGSLLLDGIGDTIRVSLSEEPEFELPVARRIMDAVKLAAEAPSIEAEWNPAYSTGCSQRRESKAVGCVGGQNQPVVVAWDSADSYDSVACPDLFVDNSTVKLREISAADLLAEGADVADDEVILLTTDHANVRGHLLAAMHRLTLDGVENPVILKVNYRGVSADDVRVRAAMELGSLLLAGFADGIMIDTDSLSAAETARLAFGILQSTRLRFTRTEYISCPGCGRTLFDLQKTLARVKEATSHLKGLKIGVMGCIVNGPGEMADADYGYVGAGVGKVSLYKGKECIEKNIPTEEAVEHLVNLIKRCGDWK